MSYDLGVTTKADGPRRERLDHEYASPHAGRANVTAATLVYRRDIRPMLPPTSKGPRRDIGCGQGALVRLLMADGCDAEGVDVSPEQVALARSTGLSHVQEGGYRELLNERVGCLAAVTATAQFLRFQEG
jgi:2-polyprenyl-3-methyl-5-hydroxy-6-metoxy-1,4-benzoquinol methylase